MTYTVNELAGISGVTVRTLHHYDQIGLLCPGRSEENGYRVYGPDEVDKLQQILLYRELGFPLKQIKDILSSPDFKREKALEKQLDALIEKKSQVEQMIVNVQRTISVLEGEEVMNDEDKFMGFKRKLISANERTFGRELRERFGNEEIDGANEKMMQLSKAEWSSLTQLEEQILTLLSEAFSLGDPGSELAQKVCELHRQWLCSQWKEGTYSKEAHLALAEGYVADSRFTAYYDKLGKGCTVFLRDAIRIYAGK